MTRRLQCDDSISIIADSNDSGSMEVDPVHSGAVSNKRPRVSVKESQQCLPRVTITSLSIELFIEVTKYLRPGDLLSLVRCIKLFRGCLMDKNSQFIWRQSMQNVRGLPACPPGFTEPRYLAILFSNFCTVCGKNKKCQVDAILLVRLCASCQKQWFARFIYPLTIQFTILFQVSFGYLILAKYRTTSVNFFTSQMPMGK
ncbi:hypothetical protein B0J17DRAFT_662002 [Rhizoctonia solani]|nr:hypothetical protein B0J17DRAFT_662002 [Rhizoctonia solani]